MISYPLSLPAGIPGPVHMKLAAADAVGEVISPFAGTAQEQLWQDQHWELELAWPPMTRAQAAPLIAFLEALHGKYGSFLFSDPLGLAPMGSALGSPVADSASGGAGPNNPASAVNGASGGLIIPWTNPGNATGNSAYATVTLGLLQASALLICTNFGFSLSDLAEIVGMEVTCTAFASAAGPALQAQLYGPYGSLSRTAVLPTVAGTVTLGGPSDLWGAGPFLNSLLNGAGFGVTLQSIMTPSGGATVSVKNVKFTFFLQPLNQSGSNVLGTSGWQVNQSGLLLPGDYIQPVNTTGNPQRLYQVMTPVSSDSGGLATIDIYPSVRETIADSTPLILTNAAGTFRLSENRREWAFDKTRTVTISLKAREAI